MKTIKRFLNQKGLDILKKKEAYDSVNRDMRKYVEYGLKKELVEQGYSEELIQKFFIDRNDVFKEYLINSKKYSFSNECTFENFETYIRHLLTNLIESYDHYSNFLSVYYGYSSYKESPFFVKTERTGTKNLKYLKSVQNITFKPMTNKIVVSKKIGITEKAFREKTKLPEFETDFYIKETEFMKVYMEHFIRNLFEKKLKEKVEKYYFDSKWESLIPCINLKKEKKPSIQVDISDLIILDDKDCVANIPKYQYSIDITIKKSSIDMSNELMTVGLIRYLELVCMTMFDLGTL